MNEAPAGTAATPPRDAGLPTPASVAVTGAGGFLGRHVCRALLERGHRVVGILHSGSSHGLPDDLRERVEARTADVTAPSSLDAAFRGARVVVHCAAFVVVDGAPRETWRRVNADGARNVLRACLDHGVRRLVHVSSVHAFVRMRGIVLDRNASLGLDSRIPYTATKAAAHADILEALAGGRIAGAVVCPSALLGPDDDRPTPAGRLLLDVARGRFPMLVDTGYWWADVRDVAAAVARAAEADAPADASARGAVYFTAGRHAGLRRLAELCSDALGRKVTRPAAPFAAAVAALPFVRAGAALLRRRPLYTRSELALARNCPSRVDERGAADDLGYAARPLEETVRDALDSFRAGGMLP